MPDDIQNLEEYARTRANPYGITYEAICRESCVLPQIRPKSRRCAASPLCQGSQLVQTEGAHTAGFLGTVAKELVAFQAAPSPRFPPKFGGSLSE